MKTKLEEEERDGDDDEDSRMREERGKRKEKNKKRKVQHARLGTAFFYVLVRSFKARNVLLRSFSSF